MKDANSRSITFATYGSSVISTRVDVSGLNLGPTKLLLGPCSYLEALDTAQWLGTNKRP